MPRREGAEDRNMQLSELELLYAVKFLVQCTSRRIDVLARKKDSTCNWTDVSSSLARVQNNRHTPNHIRNQVLTRALGKCNYIIIQQDSDVYHN